LGQGFYKSAWLLCAKLHRAMVNPERNPLSGLVEVDETQISYRTKDDPPAGGWRRSEGKLQVATAVEIQGKEPGRVRLALINGLRKEHLQAYLDKFVFRFNRQRTPHAAFLTLLGIGLAIKPATYKMLIAADPEG
jgi:hypothetical protein